jgi:lysophospholipase L1-like esterase
LRRKYIFLAACVATALSCSSGPGVQPSPVIDDPVVSCPSDISVTAHSGQNPTVTFDTPTALKGLAPVTVVCTPASGADFKSGTTSVTCEATDARAHKASCSFSVVVTLIPQLVKTKFMAFGDSLTEGKVTLVGRGAVVVPPNVFNTSASYVEQLNAKLVARYQDQTITVIADGRGAEEAGAGKLRLTGELSTYNPDALLLLEGINDLLRSETATPAGMQTAIDSVLSALQNMIRQGKARGIRVFLATLLPANRETNLTAGINTANNLIRSLAVQEGVALVDLNAAVPTSQIGADGLHLKPAGYDLMADEWLKAIIATMEVTPSTLK